MFRLFLLPAIALLPVVAFAQERAQPLSYGHREKQQDPPAPLLLLPTRTSPGLEVSFGGFTSRQVNVNSSGQNIVGDAANEPSILVDPTNGNRMAIGWRQFNSVTSNFRTGGFAYSTNGGVNWTFPGALTGEFRSDPVLMPDASGSFFYLSLLSGFQVDLFRSLNWGANWTRLNFAHGGDKQWFTIDRTMSSGRGFHYQSWSTAGNNYGGRQFTRSTDGGFSWSDPIFIPNQPAWGTLDVDSSGNLWIGGVRLANGQLWAVRSSDAKNPDVVPITFDRSTAVNLGGFILGQQPINPAGLVGQIWLAVDRSGTSTHDNIYLLASVRPFGASNGAEVRFARSTDGGLSFEAPVRVNDDPVNHAKWHWFGSLAVAPNGRLDAVWLDTRNAANNTDSQLFYAYSNDGGVHWSPNLAVTPLFNPLVGYPNQAKMGDYMQVVSDNTGGDVAYCATFNGEQDIFYVRVAPRVPTAVSAVSRKTHGKAGVFDLPLALSGSPTVESRRSSGNSEAHQVIVTFAAPVSLTGVTVTSSDGAATATQATSGNTVTVDLANVSDAQVITIKLNNVNDGANFGDVTIPLGVLFGDTNGNGSVNASDVAQTKSQSGQPLSAGNFRLDVNATGEINATDVSIVKSQSGAVLP